VVPPFQVKVVAAVAENSDVLQDDDDLPPLFSQTVNEYVIHSSLVLAFE